MLLIFASPNAPLSRISRFRCLKCERGAHFRIAKRTPIKDFAFQMSEMLAWCSFSRRQTHPYRRLRVSDVYHASVVLIFVSPNAPLLRTSRFRWLKCKRGAQFRIAKRTTIQDIAFLMSEVREWCSFSYRQTHPYRRSCQGFCAQISKMRAWCSCWRRPKHPNQGICVSDF